LTCRVRVRDELTCPCLSRSCLLMTIVETHWMLWVGAVGFGVGVSGCFAAAVSQLQAYMGMTGRSGAWVAAGATSGTLVQLVTSQVRLAPNPTELPSRNAEFIGSFAENKPCVTLRQEPYDVRRGEQQGWFLKWLQGGRAYLLLSFALETETVGKAATSQADPSSSKTGY
jgi:hypothetical protein